MLDLDLSRAATKPRDAATLLMVRDAPAGMEVFCVERHAKSGFLGGAVVFPGGKVDDADRDEGWGQLTGAVPTFGDEEAAVGRAFAVAACREALEEAALLLARGPVPSQADIVALQSALEAGTMSFREALVARGLALDLEALHPMSRWVTPIAEGRRFDTRFFLAVAPEGQEGAHDQHETTASFWATPARVLRQWEEGKLQVFPPTQRSLELLASVGSTRDAVAMALRCSKEPICPKLVGLGTDGGTPALVLPGDPEHDVRERRVAGHTRFVLRDGRWLPESPSGVSPG